MKKLLIILGTVSLTATGTSGVVACKKSEIKNKKEDKPTPVVEPSQSAITSKEDINKEKQRKMEYFNELNNKIQKNRTEVIKKIQILENKKKDLEQQQIYIKKEIQKLAQEIEQLDNQVGSLGSEIVELAHKKQIKIAENNKNNIILELITKQLDENEKEIQQLKMQQDQEKFYISEINSILLPPKIIVSTKQQTKNEIYVMEKDINKIVLKELRMKINNNLTEFDFIIEFEPKYINRTGTVAIELSHPKTIKTKIHGKNNTVGVTGWISINLPKATVV